ncbi:MAG: porin family protein [Acidobacteriota bacterium]|nr:porin family protein [Acidobacteriota bacterium]
MRRYLRPVLVAALLGVPAPAFADATVFLGMLNKPDQHLTRGFAAGIGLLVVGFEFEYANAPEDLVKARPSLQTGMGNLLVQTPFSSVQLYGTVGGGVYRERLGGDQETNVGVNVGGGVKFSVLGPVRVRLDYRIFNLRGEPLHPTVQRFYAGANLKF